MPTVYTTDKAKCTIIQLDPTTKFRVYDNIDHFNIVRLILSNDGLNVVQRNYLVIPKEVSEEIAKALLARGIKQ